jgi:hypothetical protein
MVSTARPMAAAAVRTNCLAQGDRLGPGGLLLGLGQAEDLVGQQQLADGIGRHAAGGLELLPQPFLRLARIQAGEVGVVQLELVALAAGR